MCGIVGMSMVKDCVFTYHQREILLRLGAFGADKRGGQSYGVVTVDPKKHNIEKGMGPLVSADFTRLAQSDLVFGHSRFATQGAINLANSHPFKIGRIVGAHNGVIFNASELDRKYGKRAVDSEHIFARINKNKGLDDFEGYGIAIWHDLSKPGKVYLSNIGDGSLTLFELWDEFNDFAQGYFWTSLEEDGRLALAGAGIENYDTRELEEGIIYEFEHGGDTVTKLTEGRLALNKRRLNSFHMATSVPSNFRRADGSNALDDEDESEEEVNQDAENFFNWINKTGDIAQSNEGLLNRLNDDIECAYCGVNDSPLASFGSQMICQDCMNEYEDESVSEAKGGSSYLDKEYASIQDALNAKMERER